MQINKLAVLNIGLTLALVGVAVHQKYFQSDEITGSRWACATYEEDFFTKGYRRYEHIKDRSVVVFSSDRDMYTFQKGSLLTKTGESKEYEMIFNGKYKVDGHELSVDYQKVSWNHQPTESEVFIRDMNSYVGTKTDFIYKVENDRLFFFNQSEAEESNFVCYRI
ncbi:hypothetical protein [Vibrio harveyi]|uniref:hypothetical protein n=1 Tax=Vibrio harveyi TaxID=669 RepID=UPI00068353DD|nr:hypothetical protein [Vibrio harveyi]